MSDRETPQPGGESLSVPLDDVQGQSLVFGQIQHPKYVDRTIPAGQTYAWDDLGKREPLGAVMHSMVGSLDGTDRWFRYNPETGRWPTGLTDYGIGGATDGDRDGVIYRWNDPRGRRAGWANGGSDGLEGDGILWVRHMGINAINRYLVSIERSDGGDITTPVSPKQFESMAHLTAYWFDQAMVPHHTFPLNPNIGPDPGLVTHFWHLEFATKACPFNPVVSLTDALQERVREIMTAAQTPIIGIPTAPTPPAPDHSNWPGGYTIPRLSDQFGTLEREDGKRFPFDSKGPISNAWANRGARERLRARELPKPIRWYTLDPTVADDPMSAADVIVFERDWILLRRRKEIAWLWVN